MEDVTDALVRSVTGHFRLKIFKTRLRFARSFFFRVLETIYSSAIQSGNNRKKGVVVIQIKTSLPKLNELVVHLSSCLEPCHTEQDCRDPS